MSGRLTCYHGDSHLDPSKHVTIDTAGGMNKLTDSIAMYTTQLQAHKRSMCMGVLTVLLESM